MITTAIKAIVANQITDLMDFCFTKSKLLKYPYYHSSNNIWLRIFNGFILQEIKNYKMKKTIIVAGIALALVFAGVSCNKYEDGPGISFRGKKNRVDGKWKVSTATYDDNDIAGLYEGMEKTYFYEGTYALGGSNGLFSYSGTGTWEFNDDKTAIVETEDGSNTATTYTITKLKHEELWLKRTDGAGGLYVFHLEPAD